MGRDMHDLWVLVNESMMSLNVPSKQPERFARADEGAVSMWMPGFFGSLAAALKSVDGTLTGNFGLGGPGFTIGGSRTDEITGFGDLAPMFNLRWNDGVNNYTTFITGNVGRYDPDRLANLGIGH